VLSEVKRINRDCIHVYLVVLLSIAFSSSGEGSSPLEESGLYLLPEGDSLSQSTYPEDLVSASPLSADDIAPDFSNLGDLAWLEPVALENRCVMIGENHYFHTVYSLENRILFALNSFDHFPLVVFELQYSLTPYINWYLDMQDDSSAAAYLEEILPMVTFCQEDATRLMHIRRWNLMHPRREIHVGCSDIEHDYRTTLSVILLPYLRQVDPQLDLDADNIFFLDLLDRIPELRADADSARRAGVCGAYPFITPDYIDRVLDNLEVTCHAKINNGMNFMYMRQRVIVRNLTDPLFLGEWTRSGKFVVICGASHARTGSEFALDGNFLSEGAFLQHDFEPTAGQCFSVYVDAYAYTLDSMEGVDLSSCGHLGSGYRQAVTALQTALNSGLISASTRLMFMRDADALDLLILSAVNTAGGGPALLHASPDGIAEAACEAGYDTYRWARIGFLDTWKCFDALIVVPSSPITIAIPE
jgi:hypothetical protein